MRHVCFWQYQLLQRGQWELKKIVMEFAFNVTRLATLVSNCSFLDYLMVYCMNWTCRTHRKMTAELANRRWDSPSAFLLHERVCQTFCRTQKKATDELCQHKENCCFMEKSARYYGPIGWRWMPQQYRRTLGDCPGSEMSLSFLEFWKLLTMHFLFT